ncbi:hypothetical protein [Streptomyces sp. NPDC056401]|uniref:hypothetical protein n=1 Tax=Streptomyces sp. NPDC056401 TaxID=3345809 RepID=UPI0035E25183
MITEDRAREIAEQFGKASIPRWREWDCRVKLDASVKDSDYYVFAYPAHGVDAQGRQFRLGGNLPIFVKKNDGSCRFAKSFDEYFSMRANRK